MKQLSFIDRNLTLWIVLAMLAGVTVGTLFPAVPAYLSQAQRGATNIPLALGLILMMYPPLANVRYDRLTQVFSDRKILLLSLAQNWVLGPMLMFLLASVCLPDLPDYRVGLALIGIARCIAMVIVWTDLAGGSRTYTAGLVAFNSVFQVVLYPVYAWFFVTELPTWLGMPSFAVSVSIADVAQSVALYLGTPFLAGILTQWAVPRIMSRIWLEERLLPALSPLTLVALLGTIVLMFSLKGSLILALPIDVARIAAPLTLYFGLMFFSAFYASRRVGAGLEKAISLAFTAAGNNFELGIAVAISVFGIGSPVAFATVIGPLIEVPVLLMLIRWVRRKNPQPSLS